MWCVPQIRQNGRRDLQAVLHQRAEGRFKARTVHAMAAGVSNLVMANLDTRGGSPLGYVAIGGYPSKNGLPINSPSHDIALSRAIFLNMTALNAGTEGVHT